MLIMSNSLYKEIQLHVKLDLFPVFSFYPLDKFVPQLPKLDDVIINEWIEELVLYVVVTRTMHGTLRNLY